MYMAELNPIAELLHEELREACREGSVDKAQDLITAGADITAKDDEGADALSHAAFNGHREVALLLLSYGASPVEAVEEAERGGWLSLAEYLRVRKVRTERDLTMSALEEARKKETDILARKARFAQQRSERERRKRGEKLAQQMQRAAEHRLLVDQRTEEAAQRVEARHRRQEAVRARRDELEQLEAKRWGEERQKNLSKHSLIRDIEEQRLRDGEAARINAFQRGVGTGSLSVESIHSEPEAPWELPARLKREAIENDLRRREDRRQGAMRAKQAAGGAKSDEKFRVLKQRRNEVLAKVRSESSLRLEKLGQRRQRYEARVDLMKRSQTQHQLEVQAMRHADHKRAAVLMDSLATKYEEQTRQKREVFESYKSSHGSLTEVTKEAPPRGPKPLRPSRLPPVVALAARQGDEETLAAWVADGEEVPVAGVDEKQRTALGLAAVGGHVGCAKLLLAHGADARAADAAMRTPLHEAVRGQHHELVQLLLHKGARASAKDAEGRTPLQLARLLRRGRGDEKMVALLEYANQNQAPATQPNW